MYYRKKSGRKQIRPSKETFEYQYYILGLNAEEMSKQYNVKPATIYNWATHYRKEAEKTEVQ